MAVQRLYQIRCDNCGYLGDVSGTNAAARTAARSHGIRRVRIGEYIGQGITPNPRSMMRRDHAKPISRDLCLNCRQTELGFVQAKVDAEQARYGYERVQAAQ